MGELSSGEGERGEGERGEGERGERERGEGSVGREEGEERIIMKGRGGERKKWRW